MGLPPPWPSVVATVAIAFLLADVRLFHSILDSLPAFTALRLVRSRQRLLDDWAAVPRAHERSPPANRGPQMRPGRRVGEGTSQVGKVGVSPVFAPLAFLSLGSLSL